MDFIGSRDGEELGSGRQRPVEWGGVVGLGRRRGAWVGAAISADGVGEENGDVGLRGPTGGCKSTGRNRWTRLVNRRRGPNRRLLAAGDGKCSVGLMFVVVTRFRWVSAPNKWWPRSSVQRRSRRLGGAAAVNDQSSPARDRDEERHEEHGRGCGELRQLGKMR
uniref:DUF834 domain-containing protein n=1 Tax=Oryza glumipatula TaxID=40148 RepID=A0A0D9Y5U9_9ORYZ